MKAATISEIKRELKEKSSEELTQLCLRLAKFKKENKELLTYLLYESEDDTAYINSVKAELDIQFAEINTTNYYWIKKTLRKILRNTKKYIRYTQSKAIEVELLIYFCSKMNLIQPSIHKNGTLKNLYLRQVQLIKKNILLLPEDLQYDYTTILKNEKLSEH
ncbi:hypothetical protein GCM10011506_09550 [Marivirga lumbricoides]|uniref:Uncharacterized protein n=1 Tax=Marivirga lumbricoides TaxID=1046115 RepID=A0A2T4DSM8_9BACT|nr:hypothetical protein C9994_05570 [Marivirga lumbricoides]GGC26271.1 hypothetical protein GCM10011506_09550 [Marivirga lumbricoides]